jgi:hypothetical protein
MLTGAVNRVASILLVLCFAGLGSGWFRHAHDAAHAAQDSAMLKGDRVHGGTSAPAPADAPRHDESNCSIHALLNAPLLHAAIVPLLVLAGLFVAFLSLLAPQPVSRRPLSRLGCRGPPSCRS